MFRAAGTCQECDSPADVHAFTPSYPMYVIPLSTLVRLDKLTVHAELLDRGLLVPWTPDLQGKVVGVSHQWLSYSEPDPRGEHFRCLARVLQRLMNGEIPRVENYWIHAWKFRTLGFGAKYWKAALKETYVWIDYCSMPQVTLGSNLGNIQQAAAAIASLPAYIERCSHLLVLAPVAQHQDAGLTCNYATWRERGWCRLELMSAILAPKDIKVMICPGAEATPFFIHPFDGPRLLVGSGRFSCCDLGHQHGDIQMECDKKKVRPVLETMIESKVVQLRNQGRYSEQTFWAALKRTFVTGLPQVSSKAALQTKVSKQQQELLRMRQEEVQRAQQTRDAVEVLKARLGWTEEHDKSAAKSGLSLLHCACLAGDTAAVKVLAASAGKSIDRGLRYDMPTLAYMWKGATPLHVAMTYAGYDCVEELLDARAAIDTACACGVTGLMAAGCRGNVKNLTAFLQRNPDFNLERRAIFFPLTVTGLAAISSPNKFFALKSLLEARAMFNDPKAWGGDSSILICAAMGEDCDSRSVKLLLENGSDVNTRYNPNSAFWGAAFKAVRALEPCAGSRLFSVLAAVEGCTPMHAAAMRGDTSLVKQLLEARARPNIKNKQGRTPLDVARAFFRDVPQQLAAALCEVSPMGSGVESAPPTHSAVLAAMEDGEKKQEKEGQESSEADSEVFGDSPQTASI